MGLMEASFMAQRALKKAGYPKRYPAIGGYFRRAKPF
jgi:hypothetical protein